MLYIYLLVQQVLGTLIQFSAHSGAVARVVVGGEELLVSLELGESASGFHSKDACPPSAKCLGDLPAPAENLRKGRKSPNPHWEITGSVYDAEVELGSESGVVRFSILAASMREIQSSRLLDVAGFVALGRYSPLVQDRVVRLSKVAHADRSEGIALFLNQGLDSAVRDSLSVELSSGGPAWSFRGSVALDGVALGPPAAVVELDLSFAETQIPDHWIDGSGLELVTSVSGRRFLACGPANRDEKQFLEIRVSQGARMRIPVSNAVSGATCITSLAVYSGETLKVGSAVLEEYQDIVLDAEEAEIRFRYLGQLPQVPAPVSALTALPVYERIPAKMTPTHDVFTFRRLPALTTGKALYVATRMRISPSEQLVLVRHPLTPPEDPHVNYIGQHHGRMWLGRDTQGSLAVRAKHGMSGDRRLRARVTEFAVVVERVEVEQCSVCRDGMVESEVLQLAECRHRFHLHCIRTWLTNGYRNCPLCRAQL